MIARTPSQAHPPAADQLENTAPCKICGAPAALFGVVDFNKTCHEAQGALMPLAGVPVYYRRCGRCGFLFTDHFDAYTASDFQTRIYNDDYAAIDPDFAERRPAANAALIDKLFGAARGDISLLDYGGGSGKLAEILGDRGWTCQSYDPFHGNQPALAGRFELVTCFEVFEHTPDPKSLLAALDDLLAGDGLILFSTLLQPANIEQLRLNWWYAAPRNGHISLFSKQSLALLCRGNGLNQASFNDGLHVAFRRLPDFAGHLARTAPGRSQAH